MKESLTNEKLQEIRDAMNTAREIKREDPATNPPGFMFRVKQWLGDNNIMLMDWDARGMHMHFMSIAWQQNPPGTLPNDDTKLRRWIGNHPKWKRLKPQIFNHNPEQSSWKLVDDLWVQEALLKEFIRQAKFRITRKNAAQKRWQKQTKGPYEDAYALQESNNPVPKTHSLVSVQCSINTPPTEGVPKAPQLKEPSDSEEVKPADTKKNSKSRTNLRLEIFAEEYAHAKNNEYLIGDYRKEGGAAKRTQTKIPDDKVYRQAVRAYLASTEPRVIENAHSFMWFIGDLNRWYQQVKRKDHDAKSDEFDGTFES